jgi:hypothetical protein
MRSIALPVALVYMGAAEVGVAVGAPDWLFRLVSYVLVPLIAAGIVVIIVRVNRERASRPPGA